MVSLHIKVPPPVLGIRVGGRIDIGQIEAFFPSGGGTEEIDAVRLPYAVFSRIHAVETKVVLSPLEVTGRGIHAQAGFSPSRGGCYSGAAGVGEKVQKTFPLRKVADNPSQLPAVEKETGIQVFGKIDEETKIPFTADQASAPSV